MKSIVSRAEAHADDVLHAWTVRGLISAAVRFKIFLARIPDAGPTVTSADIQQVSTFAEKVIDHLEKRLDSHWDSHDVKLELASLIYRMRARLEEAARWGRHLHA
jgi:hypothetical protein